MVVDAYAKDRSGVETRDEQIFTDILLGTQAMDDNNTFQWPPLAWLPPPLGNMTGEVRGDADAGAYNAGRVQTGAALHAVEVAAGRDGAHMRPEDRNAEPGGDAGRAAGADAGVPAGPGGAMGNAEQEETGAVEVTAARPAKGRAKRGSSRAGN